MMTGLLGFVGSLNVDLRTWIGALYNSALAYIDLGPEIAYVGFVTLVTDPSSSDINGAVSL